MMNIIGLARDFAYIEETPLRSGEILITGECPMCGTRFECILDPKGSGERRDYTCACHFFRYEADTARVTQDTQCIPKPLWQERLQMALE